MVTTSLPFVKLSQGESPPDLTEDAVSAVLGAEIRLSQFEELSKRNMEWSAKGVLQSNIDRTGLFFESLNDSLDFNKEYYERYISVRFVQSQPHAPLKMMLLTRIAAAPQKIRDAVENCWLEMLSVHHYDYKLLPISSKKDMRDKTGYSWLSDRSRPVSVSVLYPAVGFLNGSGKESNHSIPIVGNWSPTATSLESAWRALNNYPYPVMMDLLLKATLLRPEELMAFDSILDDLKKVADGNGSVSTRVQAGQWLELMNNRMSKFASVYMLQVRLATAGDMLSYLPREVGTALTYQSILDQRTPFQGVNIISSRGAEAGDWAQRIAKLEFIDLPIALPPYLQNFPFYATLAETQSVARFVFTPKGGIPNLLVEEA